MTDHEQRLNEVKGLANAADRALQNACTDRPDLVQYLTERRNEWQGLADDMSRRSS
ncbi:hypothetical protein [Lentzea sp. NPDC092896]|uniref:hypothetical protein n=1 Tax=Lentzea sp. NPDC092896 TaxID=3364127 RepID=UPI00381466FD